MRLKPAWRWLLAVPPLLLAVPPLLLGAVLYWLAASESGLRFIARQAVALGQGKLAIDGARGALVGPLRLQSLRLETAEQRFELRGLHLDWSPGALRQRQLEIGRLELRELRVTRLKPSPEPLRPPASLRLPLGLKLPSARLERLAIVADGREWLFGGIEFGLAKPAQTYRLDLRALATPWGGLSGHTSLGEAAPFPLVAEARFRHGSGEYGNGELLARADGRLERFKLGVGAALAGGQGRADLLLTPFARRPVESARIDAQHIDPAAWDKTLPKADLGLRAELRGLEGGAFSGDLSLGNALPGTWDRGRLPLKQARARLAGGLDGVDLRDLRLDLDRAGVFDGAGRVDADGARLDLHSENFDPRGLHGKLISLRLAGAIQLRAEAERLRLLADLGYRRYRLRLDLEQQARVLRVETARLESADGSLSLFGTLGLDAGHPYDIAGGLERFNPGAYGDYPAALVNASFNASGRLAPAPEARLIFAIADSHFRHLPLSGQGHLRIAEKRLWDSDAKLRLGTNRLALRGAFGAPGDQVTFQASGDRLDVIHAALSGRVEAGGMIGGSLAAPSGQVEIEADQLGWGADYRIAELRAQARVEHGLDGQLALQADVAGLRAPKLELARASVAAAGTRGRHTLRLAASTPDFDLDADLAGGLSDSRDKPVWSGRVEHLANRGRYPLSLLAPARLSLGADRLRLEAAALAALGARFNVRELAYEPGRLRGAGEFNGLGLDALKALLPWPDTLGGDLVLGGDWRLDAGETLSGQLGLARERGDLVLADTALGLSRLRLTATADNNQLRASLEAEGGRLGSLRGNAASRLSRRDGVWGLGGDAPLRAEVDLDLRSLAWAAPLLDKRGISAFDGQLSAHLTADGSLAAPRLSGTLSGERFSLALPDHGLRFSDGRFQAELRQDRLELQRLSLRGGDGSLTAQGSLALRESRPDLRLALRAEKLTVFSRPDRLLILSGDGNLALAADKLRLDARLKADRGQFELAADDAPSLSEDVVVLGREAPARPRGLPWDVALDLDLDLGDRFFLRARGLDAQLGGSLKLAGRKGLAPRANGSIRVLKGAYAAYGQRLEIERGILNFQGPLDNPGLNIAAWRRGLEVEAGVGIGGTAQAPVVRLISRPTLPDSEKLSWLVLGHGLAQAGGQEFDLMQLAAGALLGAGESVTLQQRVAHAAGLEEVSLKGAGSLESSVLTLGKRLSSRAYLSYEQGLAGSDALVKINYTLTRRLSLRAQAGATPALDLFYTFSFD